MGQARRRFGILGLVALIGALLPMALAVPASANHGSCVLDVMPETGTNPLGQSHTLTATLRPAGTNVDTSTTSTATCDRQAAGSTGQVDVLFEVVATSPNTGVTYSPNTVDAANSALQPDLGCSIPGGNNNTSCTVSYTRLTAAGADEITAWVDENGNGQFDTGEPSDVVTKTWTAPTAAFINIEPESDSNPPQTAHTLTVTVRDTSGNLVSGADVDFEILSGPNANLDAAKADRECTTGNQGTCTISYTDGAQNPAAPNNVDTICGWLDTDGDDVVNLIGTTAADGGDCDQEAVGETEDSSASGTDTFGNDTTDTVQKTWQNPTLTITPNQDSASVGACNPFTIALRDGSNQPITNVNVDVEQIHTLATNNTTGDEPTVTFCTPTSGPNPSGVDENRGDRRESPDNNGTAGGETSQRTDSNGQVTIGIASTGTGQVTVTAFYETTDNDDPDAGEPTGTAIKTWVTPEARTIDCEPETASAEVATTHTVTCTVRDRFGDVLGGVNVVFTSTGPGGVVSQSTATTNTSGQAAASVQSFQLGTTTVTGTLEADTTGAEPAEVDPCDRAAGDPSGAPAGVCADDVTVTWGLPTTGSPVPEVCATTTGAFIGSDGNDTITGTTGNDVICGRGGDDTIAALEGDDLVLGGAGNDIVNGGGGNDRLLGGADNDTLRGGDGSDVAIGGGGNDIIKGGTAADSLYGRAGSDTIGGGAGPDLINGGTGVDSCSGGPGQDRIRRCEN